VSEDGRGEVGRLGDVSIHPRITLPHYQSRAVVVTPLS